MTGVMKKRILLDLALAAFIMPQAAFAQAVITEIMYDPAGTDSGHEWIEVYNAGTSSIPLSNWKVYEGDANHNIVAASSGGMLAPDSYAVIAESAVKFESDYPEFTGQLFHSAFSLDNVGATIILRDKSLDDIDTVSYDSAWGGLGDGNSLQREPGEAGDFVPRAPSPGAAISAASITPKAKLAAPPKPSKRRATKGTANKSSVSDPSPAPSDISDTRAQNDAGNMAVVANVSAQTAAANAAGHANRYWWLAAFALMALAASAIIASKHFKKTEWDIVEEKSEDV